MVWNKLFCDENDSCWRFVCACVCARFFNWLLYFFLLWIDKLRTEFVYHFTSFIQTLNKFVTHIRSNAAWIRHISYDSRMPSKVESTSLKIWSSFWFKCNPKTKLNLSKVCSAHQIFPGKKKKKEINKKFVIQSVTTWLFC